jgi:ferredoxin
MSSDQDDQGHTRKGGLTYLKSKDPLVYLGIIVLVVGLTFTAYGFVPVQTPSYQTLPQPVYVPVVVNGTNAFLSVDQAQAKALSLFNGTANRAECVPSGSVYTCYGQVFHGIITITSDPAKEYGGAMDAVGIVAFYFGYRYEPLTIKKKEMHSIRIRVDEDICIANGVCIELAPQVFQFKKQQSPSLLAPLAYVVDPIGASNEEILQAAQMCPTGAIIIEDEETGERIHPPLPNS